MAPENRTDQAQEQAGSGRAAGGRFSKGASGNPDGRPPRAGRHDGTVVTEITEQVSRFDGWFSLLSGLGTATRDKRESYQFMPDVIDWQTAENMYRGDDLAARIIETLPNEMMREGYDLCITDDDDDGQGPDAKDKDAVDATKAKPAGQYKTDELEQAMQAAKSGSRRHLSGTDLKMEIEHQWEELGLMDAIHEALCFERAYGGSAILVGAQDGATDLREPLAVANVTSVDYLTALEPREISPVAWYGDPKAKKFGKPAIYQLTPSLPGSTADGKIYASTTQIHESRLIIFGGVRVTRRQLSILGGWGDSILTRVYRVLRDYNLTWGAAGVLVCDFAQAVYKMKGLNDLLREDSKDLFKNRMVGMEMARSVARATMIDSEDEFERKQTPVAGLPDLLDRFTQRLCMAAKLPMPLLAGESPGGINASGASGDQLRMFYDSAKSEQKRKVVPAIRRVTYLQFQAMKQEPAQWTVEPRPLWQPTQKEQIETRKIQCDIDCAYVDRGVNDPQEIRDSRFGGKSYSYDTKLADNAAGDTSPEAIAAFMAEQTNGAPVAKPPVNPAAPAVPPVGAPPAPAKPGAPPPTFATSSTDLQKEALNGVQIASMVDVIKAVMAKEISRESGAAVLALAFQLDDTEAAALLGPANFVPAPPVEPGGGQFNPGPPAPAAPAKPEAKPPIGGKVDRADKAARAMIDALLDELAPDGECAGCGEKGGALEVDHVNGRDWDPASMSKKQRAQKYWEEYEDGVDLQALCRTCNAVDGAKNKQISRGEKK